MVPCDRRVSFLPLTQRDSYPKLHKLTGKCLMKGYNRDGYTDDGFKAPGGISLI